MAIVTRGLSATGGPLVSFGLGIRGTIQDIIDLGLDIHHFVVEVFKRVVFTAE